MLFRSVCSLVCSLVLDYFAGDAFVAGDIDHIDAGRKGTHTEMGVGTKISKSRANTPDLDFKNCLKC